ncbi:hypothetical protein RCS94_10855 [Orbaceae bacterium ac157xtp]
MEKLTDLIFRYAIIFGKRFSIKDKIAFLRVITKELMQLNYRVDTKVAKLALTNKKNQHYYNAYIGDLEKADLIIATYYDTAITNFNLLKTYAFQHQFSKISYFIGIAPIIFVFLLSVILNWFIFIPHIQYEGFFSVSGILTVLSTLFLFYLILKYKNGIPNKNNFVCNSSSIITIINLIQKLDKKEKKKIAFVLLDAGCTNQYGLKMLENYSKTVHEKTFIFLDSIGNGDELCFFKSPKSKLNMPNQTININTIDTSLTDYLLISSGKVSTNKQILIANAHSRKDKQLSPERLEKHTQTLLELCQNFIQQST